MVRPSKRMNEIAKAIAAISGGFAHARKHKPKDYVLGPFKSKEELEYIKWEFPQKVKKDRKITVKARIRIPKEPPKPKRMIRIGGES